MTTLSADSAFSAQKKPMPWWLPFIMGIALLVIGVLLFMYPARTTVILVQALAVYWLLEGIFELVSLFFDRTAWGWKLFGGIIGILAGYYIITQPLTSTVVIGITVIILLGIQALILGVINLIQAFRGGGWGIGILGVVNIIFGLLLLGNSLIAAATLPWVIGAFAIIGGIAAMYMGFKLRKA